MKIHTDKLTERDLWRELPDGLMLDVATRGSRSRARRFDVAIEAEPGTDAHGLKRIYARNTGKFGAKQNGYGRAATYIEWGDWMVALFKLDPEACIGPYDGVAKFITDTTHFAPHRPKREDAVRHARRWARELIELKEVR